MPMNIAEKLNAIRSDLRALARQCIDNDADDCCSIALLQASDMVTCARNKLSEYGIDAWDAPEFQVSGAEVKRD